MKKRRFALRLKSECNSILFLRMVVTVPILLKPFKRNDLRIDSVDVALPITKLPAFGGIEFCWPCTSLLSGLGSGAAQA